MQEDKKDVCTDHRGWGSSLPDPPEGQISCYLPAGHIAGKRGWKTEAGHSNARILSYSKAALVGV